MPFINVHCIFNLGQSVRNLDLCLFLNCIYLSVKIDVLLSVIFDDVIIHTRVCLRHRRRRAWQIKRWYVHMSGFRSGRLWISVWSPITFKASSVHRLPVYAALAVVPWVIVRWAILALSGHQRSLVCRGALPRVDLSFRFVHQLIAKYLIFKKSENTAANYKLNRIFAFKFYNQILPHFLI